MKKILLFLVLFMFPMIVFADCYEIMVCSNGKEYYETVCDEEVVEVIMSVDISGYERSESARVPVDPFKYYILDNIEFYIPDIPGYIFQSYSYEETEVEDLRQFYATPYFAPVKGSRCVYDTSTGAWDKEYYEDGKYVADYRPLFLESEWIPVDMVVRYNNNGGTGISSATASGTNNGVTLSTPTRTGYTFTGWYYDSALTKKVGSNKIIDLEFKTINDGHYGYNTGIKTGYEQLELYAGWTKDAEEVVCPTGQPGAKIVFNTNGGTAIESATTGGGLGANNTALPVPVKAGYIFDGWYYDTGFSKKVEGSTIANIEYNESKDSNGCYVTVTVNIYAKWKENDNSNNLDDGTIGNIGNGNNTDNSNSEVNSGEDEIEDTGTTEDAKNPSTGAFATGIIAIVALGILLFILYKKHYLYNKFQKL